MPSFPKKPTNLDQGPVAGRTSNQVLVFYPITSNAFQVDVMTEAELKNVTAKNKRVGNRLEAALESFIEYIVKKVKWSTRKNAEVTEALIDNHGFIAPLATVVE